MRNTFINAIYQKKLVELTFRDSDGSVKTRTCVPFDYGPSSRSKDKSDRYHFWDINSPDGSHNLSLLPNFVINIIILEEYFEPSEYVRWTPKWHFARDWGRYS